MRSLLSKLPPASRAVLSAIAASVLFVAVWAFLDGVLNLRYPSRNPDPLYRSLLPSVDVCVLLAVFAAVGSLKQRVPTWLLAAVTVVMAFVRLFRIADGTIQWQWFRNVNLYLDVPLLADLARLLRASVPLPRLILGGLLLMLGLAALLFLIFAALVYAQRFLASGWWQRGVFACLLLLFLVAGVSPSDQKTRSGVFEKSVAPMFVEQLKFAISAKELRRLKADQIRATQRRLEQMPSSMTALRGADVLFFLIESYGSSVFRKPELQGIVEPELESFRSTLTQQGYFMASKYFESCTYGGGSWWAHATLATGVRVGDGLEYAVVLQIAPPPRTLASTFQQAGYRTVLVQPGMTRPFPEGMVHGFVKKYYLPHLEYRGPNFSWAPVPDQYVVDFIDRREVEPHTQPLFIQYVLVSSHAPWSTLPTPVDDWSQVRDTAVFQKHQKTFPVGWSNLGDGGPAYGHSIAYDFEIIRRYLLERLTHNSLIIILGDHQPAGSVTGNDPSWAVPVHVLSRDRSLIERFVAAGYTGGMTPSANRSVPGMETFFTELVGCLSAPDAPPPSDAH
jgi:hypothetical protein